MANKRNLAIILSALCISLGLTACGSNQEVTQFREEIDSFCTSVSELNDSINNIDAEADGASETLLGYLDELDTAFQGLAELDFPKDYTYLEPLADEAASYMSEAVSSYHEAYEGESYDAETAQYAQENSERALKYVRYLLAYLNGEDPNEESSAAAE